MAVTLEHIRARSRRQAMDWSLVLASQGIEAIIEQYPDAEGWVLMVEPQDYERSVAAIRQYRLENRHWHWRNNLTGPGLVFHWGSLLWCWVLVLFYWLGEAIGPRVGDAGAMSSLAVQQGEWWRLFTAVTLHANLEHLADNVTAGVVMLGLAMGRFGPGCALLAAFLAGAAGNLTGLALHAKPYEGLGASGMVMGALGLLAAQSFFLLRASLQAWRQVLVGALAGLLLFVLLGLSPEADVIAHGGGFVFGVIAGAVLAWLPLSEPAKNRLDRLAAGVAACLLLGTWAWALHRAGSL